MPYELVQIIEGEFGQRWPFGADEITVGRSDKATITLGGGTISRKHVRLWQEEGIIAAEDLGSRNGIKINGIRTRSGSLSTGDRLEVGNFVFVVASDENPSPDLVAPSKVKKGESDGQAMQKRMLQDPDANVNAALVQATRLQTYLFEPEKLYVQMLKVVMQTIQAQRAYLVARQPGNREMQVLANVHRNGADGPALNATTVEHVFSRRTPIITGDTSDPEYALKNKADQPGVICAPLLGRKGCLGVLYLDSGWTPSRFVAANMEDLKAFGIAFGITLENATLAEEMRVEDARRGANQAASALGKTLFELAGVLADDVANAQQAGDESNWDDLKQHAAVQQRLAQHLVGFGSLDMLSRSPLNINKLVERALLELKPEIEAKGAAVDFRHDARAVAYADQHQVYTVVVTLLRLAVTLCAHTDGLVSVTTENKTDGCYFIAKSNGANLPATAPAQIAEGLVSAAGMGADGIALAYSNAIIEGHSGKMRVRVDDGEGFYVAVVIPQQESATR
jgi:K+-sensing histidine kinase KdpD